MSILNAMTVEREWTPLSVRELRDQFTCEGKLRRARDLADQAGSGDTVHRRGEGRVREVLDQGGREWRGAVQLEAVSEKQGMEVSIPWSQGCNESAAT